MAVVSTPYNRARQAYGDGASTAKIDFVNDTIRALLVTSAYTPNYDTHGFLSDITNELAGNGYSRQLIGNKSWVRVGSGAGAKFAFKSDKATFSASGGSLTARRAILFKDTGVAGTSLLLCAILLDDTAGGTDVVSSTGIEITPDATNGWYDA